MRKASMLCTMAWPLLAALAQPCAAAGSAALPAYRVATRFPVGGSDTHYDYLRVDAARRRLYVTHGSRVEVLDADTGARLGAIEGLAGAHGVELVASVHAGFATSGADRTVVMFDTRTLARLRAIRYLGEKPDALQYDPASGLLLVVNGGATGDVSAIDPANGAIVGVIDLGGGKLEEIAVDGRGRAFVNDEDKSVVHVFDTRTRKRIGAWPLAPAQGPTGLAIDPAHHRLFAACGNGLLAVLDADTGRLLGTAPIGPDPDGAAYDARRGLVFTSNRDGTLSVVGERSPQKFELLQTVETGPGARTLALDERTGRLFLPSGRFEPAAAAKAAATEPRMALVPDSFAVLVVAP